MAAWTSAGASSAWCRKASSAYPTTRWTAQEYELFKMESKRLLTKESLLELLQEFNEQTASLATVLMEMGKLV